MELSLKKYPLEKVTKSDLWNASKYDLVDKDSKLSVVEFLKDGKEDNILICDFNSLSIEDKMLIAVVCGAPSLSLEEESNIIKAQRFLFLARFTRNLATELYILFKQKFFGQVKEQTLHFRFLDDVLSMTPSGLQLIPFSQSAYFKPLKELLKRFIALHKEETLAQECLDMLEHFDDFDRYNHGLRASLKALCSLIKKGWSWYESKIVAERLKKLGKL